MSRQLDTETSRSFGSPNSGTILPFRGDQRSFLGAEYRRLTILSACQGESSSMYSPMLLT